MRLFDNKYLRFSFIILALFAYFLYLLGLCMKTPLNSDLANMVFEAKDILAGNIFLNNWQLTGLTFYFTDLFFYVLGNLFAGVTANSIYFATALMIFSLSLASLMLLSLHDKKLTPLDVLIFLVIAGIPSAYLCDVMRIHTACMAYVFLSFYFIKKYYNREDGTRTGKHLYPVLFTLILSAGVMSDFITVVIGILPLIVYSLFSLYCSHGAQRRNHTAVLSLTVLSLVLGKTGELLFFVIGNADRNSYLVKKLLFSFAPMARQAILYVKCVMALFGADSCTTPVIGLNSVFCFSMCLVIVYGFILTAKNIVLFFKCKHPNTVSTLLSFSVLFISVSFVISDISIDLSAGRYMGFLPFAFAVIILNDFKDHLFRIKMHGRVSIRIPICFISALLLLFSLSPVSFHRSVVAQDGLGSFLQQNGLKQGYASFWNASSVTLVTAEKVKIRAVTVDITKKTVNKFSWFCRDDWYDEPGVNFIVTDDGNWQNVGTDSVIKCLGAPQAEYKYAQYTVLLYDRDLSNEIKK